MRYRIYETPEADEQLFQNEDELIEAISSRGWELESRAAQKVLEGRAHRFRLAHQSTIDSGRNRRSPAATAERVPSAH